MTKEVEIIQQWQYAGKVRPELLEDKAFKNCKEAGITSLESYVIWSEIEKEPGKVDFSSYDVLAEKLKKHNLKWVPFLIAGPSYATPEWFQKSKESLLFKCLEHGKESKNQSIWNPDLPKNIERFLESFSDHYRDRQLFESIILGISGNWGEAIYPAGGYFIGENHVHLGFWCGDRCAKDNFQKFILKKYQSLDNLNRTWGIDFKGQDEIIFPTVKKQGTYEESVSWLLNFIRKNTPDSLRNLLKKFLKAGGKKAFLFSETGFKSLEIKNSFEERRWLDFIDWYLNSMTDFSEFWLKTARKYFPNNKIYLVTGGTNDPILGADLSQQTKIAAKYKAGIRVTNQTNDYSQSFILTRLVSSSARFYKTYFTTEEEAILQTKEGVAMRIFDAASSGADGFYCQNIIGTGKIPCLKKGFAAGIPTEGAKSLAKNIRHMKCENPIIKTAVFFPNTSVIFNPSLIALIYNQCASLRDILDFDLIDERMIKDGALDSYEFLLILGGEIPEGEISKAIKSWSEKGGRVMTHPKKEDLKIISKSAGDIDGEEDGVYATRFQDKILYYNSTNSKIIKKAGFLNKTVEIEPNSIQSINI